MALIFRFNIPLFNIPYCHFCDIFTISIFMPILRQFFANSLPILCQFFANPTPFLRHFCANSAPYLYYNCLSPTCIQLIIIHFLPLSGLFSFSQVNRKMQNRLKTGAEYATSGLDSDVIDRFPGPPLMLKTLERLYGCLT